MTKVLDASFLMDYEAGVPDARAYLRANADQEFLLPSVIYAEFLFGFALGADGTVEDGRRAMSFVDAIHPVSQQTADLAAAFITELGPQAPDIYGIDALVVGVALEVDGTVVSRDRAHAHPAVRDQVLVDVFRDPA